MQLPGKWTYSVYCDSPSILQLCSICSSVQQHDIFCTLNFFYDSGQEKNIPYKKLTRLVLIFLTFALQQVNTFKLQCSCSCCSFRTKNLFPQICSQDHFRKVKKIDGVKINSLATVIKKLSGGASEAPPRVD